MQDLEARCLLSGTSVSDESLLTNCPTGGEASVSDPSLVQLSTVGMQEIINASASPQIPLIYGPTWTSGAFQAIGTPQTPAEDLYDEGAGAVWGSLSDEGGPSLNMLPNAAGAVGANGIDDLLQDFGAVATGDTAAAGVAGAYGNGFMGIDDVGEEYNAAGGAVWCSIADDGVNGIIGCDDVVDYGGVVWGTIADEGIYGGVDDVADYGATAIGGLDDVADYGDGDGVISGPADGGTDSGIGVNGDDGDYGPGDYGDGAGDYGTNDTGTIGSPAGDYGAGAYGAGDDGSGSGFDIAGALDSGFDDMGGIMSDGGYGTGANGGGESGTDGNHAPVGSNANWTIDEQPAPVGLVPPIVAGTVQASDADNDAIMYTITGQKGQKADNTLVDGNLWYIEMGTGKVYTRNEVDYEAYKRWYLEVQVSDMRGGSSKIGVVININDVDEAPIPYGPNMNIPYQDLSNVEGEAFTYESARHFAVYDPEGVHPLNVTATNLPKGFEMKTRLFDSDPDPVKEFMVTDYWIEGRLKQDSAGLYHVHISVADQSGHSVAYDFDWEVLNFHMDIYQMTFSQGHEITPDPQVRGVTPDPNYLKNYSGPQWLDANRDGDVTDAPTDHQYPYAFHRTQTGRAGGEFVLENAFKIGAKISIHAAGTDNYNISAAQEFWLAGGMATTGYSGDFSKAFDASKYYSAFTLAWQFSIDGGTTWEDAGQTVNRLYVTYKAPLITTLFETVIHVSTVAAEGAAANTDGSVADAIFAKFETRSISRFDGNKAFGGSGAMTYCGFAASNPKSAPASSGIDLTADVATLLEYTDGACAIWAQFYISTLRVQGVEIGEQKTVLAKNGDSLVIKNVSFGTPHNYSDQISGDYFWKWGENFELTSSIEAQGGVPRPQVFNNHVLVLVAGNYYDPSFGRNWATLYDFQEYAIAGFMQSLFVRKPQQGVLDLRFAGDEL